MVPIDLVINFSTYILSSAHLSVHLAGMFLVTTGEIDDFMKELGVYVDEMDTMLDYISD
jgi:hypothetical protein